MTSAAWCALTWPANSEAKSGTLGADQSGAVVLWWWPGCARHCAPPARRAPTRARRGGAASSARKALQQLVAERLGHAHVGRRRHGNRQPEPALHADDVQLGAHAELPRAGHSLQPRAGERLRRRRRGGSTRAHSATPAPSSPAASVISSNHASRFTTCAKLRCARALIARLVSVICTRLGSAAAGERPLGGGRRGQRARGGQAPGRGTGMAAAAPSMTSKAPPTGSRRATRSACAAWRAMREGRMKAGWRSAGVEAAAAAVAAAKERRLKKGRL